MMNALNSNEQSVPATDVERLTQALLQIDAVKVQCAEEEVKNFLFRALSSMTSMGETDRCSSALMQGLMHLALEHVKDREFMARFEQRPQSLACDVWRFQNKKEKWVAFVGLLEGRPYEIFTGLQDDEEGIVLPKSVNAGWIVKNTNPDGPSRYDFSFQNRRGYKTTVEGLSGRFNKEYWNYAKLISGVLRHGMPVENVIRLIDSLQLESDTINTWKVGVVRALKKYANNVGDADDSLMQD